MAKLTKSTGTVTLKGAVEKVTLPAAYGWVWVKNMSEGNIFAGLSESVSAGADGVLSIPAGECGRIQTDGQDSVYLMGSGNALVVAQNYADCPFKLGGKGGEAPDLSKYATKAELDTKAEKELYGNYGINLGRLADSTVGFLSSTIGRANAATGGYSFSQGFDNTASGVASFAGGQSSVADGENALSHGYHVKTTKDNEKAFGVYNKSSTDTIFSVGDGTADDARHNAFEITTTGGKLHDKDIAVDVSNPNLLINPDFKINQRGVSGTFSETGKYFVDRWRLVSGAVTVNADGTLTLNGTISQIFENAVGDNVTASVSTGTATYDNSTKTFSITANGEIISWAKLEYGSIATPFIPPDTATELLKCMRYYEKIVCSNNMYTIACQYFNGLNNCAFTIPMTLKRVASPTSTIDYSAMSYQNSENIVNVSSARALDYTNNSVSIVADLLSPTTVCTHGWVVGFTIEIDAEIYN